jgi:2-(1,2-epoxy-1,2-dihydrophenyl)acetyl-CoA isomerase
MGADLIYMAEYAWLSFNFVKRGIIAQSAMSFILPLYLGFQRAKEILYFGEKISANEAVKLGLVNKVLPLEELLPHARKMAKKLIPPEGPTLSIKLMKKVVHEYFREIVSRTQELEKNGNKELFKTHDFREAIKVFKEKREPAFKGR